MFPIVAKILSGFTARMSVGLGKEGKKLTSVADKFVYGFGKGFQDSFYKKANAIQIGRHFSDFISKTFETVFGSESAKAVRESARMSKYSARRIGVSSSALSGFGQGLGMYGGGESDIANTVKSLNAKMTNLSFGRAEFLNDLLLKSQGRFNIFGGSGRNGMKTGAELLDEFARIGKNLNKYDPGVFEDIANQLNVSDPIRNAILDGEYKNMKLRKVLTQEELDNAAKIGKEQKRAENETDRMMKRLSVLGSELRQPLDELSIFMQKNLFGWIADNLTPNKSEKEVKDNVKDNAATLDATLTGNAGGVNGDTAKGLRQEASIRLHEKLQNKSLDERGVMEQSVLWAMAEGEDDPDKIRQNASKMYFAAKTGISKLANNESFDSVPEFVSYYNEKIRPDIVRRNEAISTKRDNEKKLTVETPWWKFWESDSNKDRLEEWETLKLKFEKGKDKKQAVDEILRKTRRVEKFEILAREENGETVSDEEREAKAIQVLKKELADLNKEKEDLSKQITIPSIVELEKWKKGKEESKGTGNNRGSWLFLDKDGAWKDGTNIGNKVSQFTDATSSFANGIVAKSSIPVTAPDARNTNVGGIHIEQPVHIDVGVVDNETGGEEILAKIRTEIPTIQKEIYNDMASQILGMLSSESQFGMS